MFDVLLQDLRYAIRGLRLNPGISAAAILSLTLGIGANSAIFSLINSVMLKPLSVHQPERLVQVAMLKPQSQWFSNPIWEQLRQRQDVFSGVFAYGRWRFNLAPGGEARYVQGDFVSGEFFKTLGICPAIGRMLDLTDDRPGCPGTAVLSYSLWRGDYGGRPDVLGKSISLNGHPLQIVGVSERDFTGIDVGKSVTVMVPVCAEDIIHVLPGNILAINSMGTSSSIFGWLKIIGRLKQGETEQNAAAGLNVIAPRIFKATLPGHWSVQDQGSYLHRSFRTLRTTNGQSDFRDRYGQGLRILMVISAIVLLIACTNVANFMLARGISHEREIAIRIALGSRRRRLVRQFLTEILFLSMIGTFFSIFFARWSVQLLVRFLDIYLDTGVDMRILTFNSAIAIATGLTAGIAPALRATRVQANESLKFDGRLFKPAAGSRLKFGLRNILITIQVSLSAVLLVGAGLMLATFLKLRSVHPGFQPEKVLLTRVDFRNGNPAREYRVWQMLDRLRKLPAVQSASISSAKPLCDCDWTKAVVIQGSTWNSQRDSEVFSEEVSDRYFQTMGTPIFAGRDFQSFDAPASPPVAVINESMARKFFGSEDPIGKYYRTNDGGGLSDPIRIVGIVRDAKVGSLREPNTPAAYTDRRQDTWRDAQYEFELRTRTEPTSLIPIVKSAIGEVDPAAVLEFDTLSKRLADSLRQEQLLAMLSGIFGAVALLLTSVGLYALISYNVVRRRKEIAIRMAVGARPERILWLMVGEAALMVGLGLLLGLGEALAMTRFIGSLLYGLTVTDPLTFILAFGMLAAIAMAASYVQAHRAAAAQPADALRAE